MMAIIQEQSTEQRELRALLALLKEGIPASSQPHIGAMLDAFQHIALQLLLKLQHAARERLQGAGLGTLDRERLIVYLKRQVINEWKNTAPLLDHFLRQTPDFEETANGTTVRVSFISAGKPPNQNASLSAAGLAAAVGKLLLLAKSILSVPIALDESVLEESDQMDIAIVIGDSFSLRRVPWFRPAMILTVPVYTLPREQEMHILWHELANLFVGRDRLHHLARSADSASFLPHRIFPTLSTPANGIDWTALSPANAPATASFDEAKAASRPDTGAQGWDVFWMYWAHTLHGAAIDLAAHSKPTFEAVDQLNYLEDWRVAHLEELVEDACATLVFKEAHYHTLYNIFNLLHEDADWTRPDFRHPAPALRLGVTLHLLHQMSVLDLNARSDAEKEYAAQPGAKMLAGWIYENRSLFFTENADAFASLETMPQSLLTNLDMMRHPSMQPADTDIQEEMDTRDLSVEQYLWIRFSYLDPNVTTSAPPRPKPPLPNKPS